MTAGAGRMLPPSQISATSPLQQGARSSEQSKKTPKKQHPSNDRARKCLHVGKFDQFLDSGADSSRGYVEAVHRSTPTGHAEPRTESVAVAIAVAATATMVLVQSKA
eukprot:CAMPEP_0206483870 /NCGR_PEP_ID=MMETSP0324_2-20121206/39671_1 /ASSEMBLY_ACC=CAM_ASM_000836 /TAXON_ID=2866 /ORGANISM="Crypthecodinium cohnii, Strain Seligo" /LENGTH=106 /DNA_ID=CAMNT_0053961979 /DNA_START=643 /DNA_END=959 /DNA_ORIENTATION=-